MNRLISAIHQYLPPIISFFLMLMIFTSRLSLGVRSISLIISLALILWAVPLRELLKTYSQHPIARAAAVLYLCFIVGTFYSHAPFSEQWHVLKSYLPLLWIGFVIAFFQKYSKGWAGTRLAPTKNQQQFASQIYISVFIYGAVLTAFLGCLSAWNLIDVRALAHSNLVTDPPEFPFGTFSFSLSFAAYASAQKMKYAPTRILFYRYLACFLFLVYFIFFVNHQRTAYVLTAFLLLFYGYQHLGIKGVINVAFALGFVALAANHTSTTFHERTEQAVNDVKIYNQGNPISSTGLRLFFIKTSYHLWQEKPFFGYGTGSFPSTYLTIDGYNINGEKNTADHPLDQPHNDYAYVLVQLGLFGFIFFLWLLFQQFYQSFNLPLFERQCSQAFILSFILGALDTTLLFYATSLTDYFFFSALFYASLPKKQS